MEKPNKISILIPIAIIIAGLIIAGAIFYINKEKAKERVAEKAINFINEWLLEEGVRASLVNIVEESGIYKIQFKIEGQEYTSYVTKDGKLLFPQEGINLDEELFASEKPSETTATSTEPSTDIPEEKLVELAKCLTEKEVKFYGASWCFWCNKQKEVFGKAAEYLPYIECSDEGKEEINSRCKDEGIQGFPTWEFNGEKSMGFKSINELAELSGCPLD